MKGAVEGLRGALGPACRRGGQAPCLELWCLVTPVVVAGAALIAYGLLRPDLTEWQALLLLAALAALAERFDLRLYGDSRVSLAFVPIFSSFLIAGMTGLAIVVPAAMLASAPGRPLYKTAYNCGTIMLAGAASYGAFRAFGRAADPGRWPEVLGPALVAAGLNFVVNSLLVAAAIAASSGKGIRQVWAEHFTWLWPHYLVLGGLGLAMATAQAAMGLWGIAVFLAPPAMMRVSLKQYVDKTTKSVMELRKAHQGLQEAHAQVTEAMERLGQAYDGTLRSLIAALDARDKETAGHSERVAELTMAIAAEMGLEPGTEEWRHVSWAALLHDVGKIAIRDEVLCKPGPLTPDEWESMRQHPAAGHDILSSVDFLRAASEIVLSHHERFDGAGYPRGLAGEEIPLGARIFSIADSFDAMTSDRPYRAAMPPEEALAEILRNSGTQFDPACVRAFLRVYQSRYVGHQGGSAKAVAPASIGAGGLSESLKRAIAEAAGLEVEG